MTSQVFYRKWRSQTLAELVGQPHVTRTLLNALKTGSISHAYLFCGPRGTGKTSTARILAKAVNCLNNGGKGEPCNSCEMCRAITEDRAMDVIEIDAASNRGIDDIRDLREKVNYAPVQARRKVYIIDEFHMLSKDASNALLKTLEEPPSHVIFILATTEYHKVLPTILSRCQHFDFRRLSRADVIAKLTQVCAAENIKIESQSLNLIARSCAGSLRDAYNLLEQLTTYYGSDIKFSQVQAMLGFTGDWRAREIVKYILENDLTRGIKTLNDVNEDGLDLQQFNREIIEYLRELLLVKTGASDALDLTSDDINEIKALAEKAPLLRIVTALKNFGQINFNNNASTLPMELAMVECYLATGQAITIEEKTNTFSDNLQVKDVRLPKIDKVTSEKTTTPTFIQEEVKTGGSFSQISPLAGDNIQKKDIKETSTPLSKAAIKDEVMAAPSLSSEIERLRMNWKQILENVPSSLKKSNAVALLRSAGIKPVNVEGDTVTLSVKHGIYKEKMEKVEYRQVAEKIISEYLGRTIKICCIHEPENNHLVKAALKMGAQITGVEEK